ncbi:unnamed protein product [Closterium sp. NIES-54]
MVIVLEELAAHPSRAGDGDGGRIGANDAAAHEFAAPLVAPHPAVVLLSAQLPGKVDTAAGDDAVPAADRQVARLYAGASMGLHGAVPCPRAAALWQAGAEGQVGPSPRCVGGEQGLGGPRPHQQQGGHHVGSGVLRNHGVGSVEVGARASVGADTGQPTDKHFDDDDEFAYWVLVYIYDLLAASSSTAMLKELKGLKGLLEAAFELCEILLVE